MLKLRKIAIWWAKPYFLITRTLNTNFANELAQAIRLKYTEGEVESMKNDDDDGSPAAREQRLAELKRGLSFRKMFTFRNAFAQEGITLRSCFISNIKEDVLEWLEVAANKRMFDNGGEA